MSYCFVQASTDPDDKRKAPPVTCKLYDAQTQLQKVEGWNRLRNPPRPLKLFQSLLNSLSNAEETSLCRFLPNTTPMDKFQL